MKKWQVLPTISASMPFQMALDELLFESQKQTTCLPQLRFYYSSERWMTVGYSFRNGERRADSFLIKKNPGIPVCERITGGGCVLHGKDLIFSLISRFDEDDALLGAVRTSYGAIHQSVKIAFEKLGFNLSTYGTEEKLPQGHDCFNFPVACDLAWKGQKVAGGAQKRSSGVLLHHESIFLVPGIRREDLMHEIQVGMGQVFSVTLEQGILDPQLIFDAHQKLESRNDMRLWKNSEPI